MTRWLRSGANWMWATWVGEDQIVYLLQRHPLSLSEYWAIIKKVSGAADPDGHVIGTTDDLERAKAMAEEDAEQPL